MSLAGYDKSAHCRRSSVRGGMSRSTARIVSCCTPSQGWACQWRLVPPQELLCCPLRLWSNCWQTGVRWEPNSPALKLSAGCPAALCLPAAGGSVLCWHTEIPGEAVLSFAHNRLLHGCSSHLACADSQLVSCCKTSCWREAPASACYLYQPATCCRVSWCSRSSWRC